jgi:hypothetical protein
VDDERSGNRLVGDRLAIDADRAVAGGRFGSEGLEVMRFRLVGCATPGGAAAATTQDTYDRANKQALNTKRFIGDPRAMYIQKV